MSNSQCLGLTCDNVQIYTLVLPNGTVAEISASQSDLFFALKGGLNRFGVVTQVKYNLYPQIPKVYVSIATLIALSTRRIILKCLSIGRLPSIR